MPIYLTEESEAEVPSRVLSRNPVLTCRYNQWADAKRGYRDQTKHYTIDYDTLTVILEIWAKHGSPPLTHKKSDAYKAFEAELNEWYNNNYDRTLEHKLTVLWEKQEYQCETEGNSRSTGNVPEITYTENTKSHRSALGDGGDTGEGDEPASPATGKVSREELRNGTKSLAVLSEKVRKQ